MGNCMTDLQGGKQSVGVNSNNGGGGCVDNKNEAVELFHRAHGRQALFTPLELSLSASNLLDKDIFSKSDPMAVIYAKKPNGTMDEIGRTEVIMNTLDPVWITKVSVDYQFEIVQPLVFRVYDVDTKYHNLSAKALKLNEQDFLGEAGCVLSEIVTKSSKSMTINLQGMKKRQLGSVTIHAEETEASKQVVEINFRCAKLLNMDLFSKSDPFLRISKIVESGGAIPIGKTEVIMNNLNPSWKTVRLSSRQYGNKENPLIIECFDFDDDGKHQLIGTLQASISQLEKIYKEKSGINFSYSKKNNTKKNTLKSQLFVDGYSEKSVDSFLDYISSGYELNFMVAVDFTASNGSPHQFTSLHYRDPSGRLNAYQQAISQVGEVIQFYDYDKRFPAWGFGGQTRDRVTSHCFNLNGSVNEPEVEGVNGIMAAYDTALHNVSLSGPTLFGQVINVAAKIATQSVSQNERKYFVLLILTDGVVTDLQETINAIVMASDLPFSILIVGVGGANFKEMEILDADDGKKLVSTSGRTATRDIVQFVPMREIQGGQITLVQSLLEELPTQFLAYMVSRNIKPQSVNNARS